MDARELLDQLLQSGKQLAEQGIAQGSELAAKGKEIAESGMDFAQQKFQLPEAGPERDKMLTNLGAGAAAGGILALLVGTQRGRKTLSTVAKVGSLAALGVLGYKVYSAYQKENGGVVSPASTVQLTDARVNERCLMIVQSMIAAAKADGVIDDGERKHIEERIQRSELDQSVVNAILTEIQKPLVVSEVACRSKSPIDSVDIYLASVMVLAEPNPQEREYLSELAKALDIDPALATRLEKESFQPI
jgi:uncharacterized membrane protein YebE (DUF533 family)